MPPPTSMARRPGSRAGSGRRFIVVSGHSTFARSGADERTEAATGMIFAACFGVLFEAFRAVFLGSRLCEFLGLANQFGQAEEIRDVIGRRDSRLDQERALRPIGFVIVGV